MRFYNKEETSIIPSLKHRLQRNPMWYLSSLESRVPIVQKNRRFFLTQALQLEGVMMETKVRQHDTVRDFSICSKKKKTKNKNFFVDKMGECVNVLS